MLTIFRLQYLSGTILLVLGLRVGNSNNTSDSINVLPSGAQHVCMYENSTYSHSRKTQIYDYFLTFEEEVRPFHWNHSTLNIFQRRLIWPIPLCLSKILFLANRYIPITAASGMSTLR